MFGFKKKKEHIREHPYQSIGVLKNIAKIVPPGQRAEAIRQLLRANNYHEKTVWEKEPTDGKI